MPSQPLHHRRLPALAAGVLLAVSLLAAACTTPPPSPTDPTNFQFRASKVTVQNTNDTFIYGTRDEPFVYNLWFRVRLGDPGSAQAGLAGDRSWALGSMGAGQSATLSPGAGGAVSFNGVKLLDWNQIADGNNHLEIVGTWTWAMEQDDVSVGGVPANAASLLEDALNMTLAQGGLPEDPSDLVDLILGDLGRTFAILAGSLFGSIPGIPDDAIGSRFYLGLGTRGTLGQIVEDTAGTVAFPTIGIPIVTVPPDIGGGRIFSLDRDHFFNGEAFDQGNGRHLYDLEMVDTLYPNSPPNVDFTLDQNYGSAPLTVELDGSATSDPEGGPLTYRWDYGDFTAPGSGVTSSHTFNTGGVYPVTLTVTDPRGVSSAKTLEVTVIGGPTQAPTNLRKVAAGCCDTYGDFEWDRVPGAQAYQVEMVPTLGCIATSATREFVGQVSGGRIQQFGLCRGSRYDIRIQAQANGVWGPWSPVQNIVL